MFEVLDTPPIRRYNGGMKEEVQAEAKLTVRLPEEVLEAMRQLAKVDDRSLNGEVVRALREFIERRSATPQK